MCCKNRVEDSSRQKQEKGSRGGALFPLWGGGWYPPILVTPPGGVVGALSPKQAENKIGWELQSS